jgi:AraC-like DNA-binding protein
MSNLKANPPTALTAFLNNQTSNNSAITRPPPIQHTIAFYQVVQMLLAVEGEDARAAVLRRAGISPALMESPLPRVTQTQFARLMTALVRHHRDEFWGLGSAPMPLGPFAVCCRMLVGHRKLGGALRAGLRYYHALLVDFVPHLQVSGGVAYLRMGSRYTLTPGRSMPCASSCSLATASCAGWLAARRIPVDDVVYQESDVARRSDASRLFQAPIHLVDSECAYRFDAKWLDLPVVQSHESVETFLHEAPACLLVKYRDQASLTERIRRLLRRYLAEEMPSLEAVSDMLATIPQTLRRDVAVEFLTQSDLTPREVAARVAFSEASTFHRAFKVWTSLTPGAFGKRTTNRLGTKQWLELIA